MNQRMVKSAMAGCLVLLGGWWSALSAQDTTWMDLLPREDTLDHYIGLKEYWSLNDSGVLEGSGPLPNQNNVFLVYNMEFADFVLKVRWHLEMTEWSGNNNSGVMYRARRDGGSGQPYYQLIGAQCEMGVDGGGFYGEWNSLGWHGPLPGCKAAILKDGWNDMVIVADGNYSSHTINGELCFEQDWSGENDFKPAGLIGLQVHHSSDYVVYFSQLNITPLNSSWEIPEGATTASSWRVAERPIPPVLGLEGLRKLNRGGAGISIIGPNGRVYYSGPAGSSGLPLNAALSPGQYILQTRDAEKESVSLFYLKP